MDRMAARRQLKWPDRFTVLQLGRLVPRKGIDNVIRAIAQLKARHAIQGELYVVGGGTRVPDPVATPEIARLSQLAIALDIAEQVHCVGRRDRHELQLYYNAADVFVTTPWYEPFGITPVEAMACARPVVGSDVGGIRTTIVDGKTGYLVPPNDANALADRLALIYSNPTAREAMGRAGRRRALQMFTWQHVVRNLARVYMEASRSRPIRSSASYRAFDPHAL